MLNVPIGKNWLHFQAWWDWSSWLVGMRSDWRPYMRLVVVEIGPLGLCLEVEKNADYPTEPELEASHD